VAGLEAAPSAMPPVNPLEEAAGALADLFDKNGIPYMVIGGIAGLVWGLRRATFDVDVTIWAEGRESRTVALISANFPPRVPHPDVFVRDTGVLPVAVGKVTADIIFGKLPYEKTALGRARPASLGARKIHVCTPEDLILHKIVSERPKDLEDVRELVRLRAQSLDRNYLDPRVSGLAQDLAQPGILDHYLTSFPNP